MGVESTKMGRRADADLAAEQGISVEEYRMQRMQEKLSRRATMKKAQVIVNACNYAIKEQKTREVFLRNTIDNSSELMEICQEFISKLEEYQFDLDIALDYVRSNYNPVLKNK